MPCVLSLLVSVTLTNSQLANADQQASVPVRFCIPTADVYPFFIFDKNKITGINPDLMVSAFENGPVQDAHLDYIKLPWKRCNLALQSGEIDFIIGGYDPTRDEVGIYPNELGFDLKQMVVSTADVCFVSIEGQQKEKTLQGMAGEVPFAVGIEAGFSQNHNPSIFPNWVVMYNHLEKYQLLEKGRVDAIVQVCSMDNYPIDTKAQNSGFENFVTLYPPYLSNPAYIIYSHDFVAQHESLAKQILLATQRVDRQLVYSRYKSSN